MFFVRVLSESGEVELVQLPKALASTLRRLPENPDDTVEIAFFRHTSGLPTRIERRSARLAELCRSLGAPPPSLRVPHPASRLVGHFPPRFGCVGVDAPRKQRMREAHPVAIYRDDSLRLGVFEQIDKSIRVRRCDSRYHLHRRRG